MSKKHRLNDASPSEWEKIILDTPPIEHDMIDRPPHYNRGGIEAIDYIEQQLDNKFDAYCYGNVMKYLHRYQYKNGIEDLNKARWYLDRLIDFLEEDNGSN